MSGDADSGVLVRLFNRRQMIKSAAEKRSEFRSFCSTPFAWPGTALAPFARTSLFPSRTRRIRPQRVRPRHLPRSNALGISRDSENAIRLFIRCLGGHKCGADAGHLALLVAEEIDIPKKSPPSCYEVNMLFEGKARCLEVS
ncbi:hypothetical protein BT93_G1920 [Corymbia citriodora subsp. variegata]|nr:hypothetical protein BT93_G1920 [Corymbia citriodora subsp. variegata]KAF8021618.1 hypothetical protein BT93_G1920 [Corymbia citriodora subsp. variegata]KAF8021619.1 hypothetical protein BT93_G1920 [Corymbia citriodora subsp. variegata]